VVTISSDLVENATFEEVAFLLWDGELPNKAQLATVRRELSSASSLPPHVITLLGALPRQTQPMDALRTALSALASTDPDLENNDKDADRRKAVRITAQLPTIVAAFHRISQRPATCRPRP